jgi:hypothetical protein
MYYHAPKHGIPPAAGEDRSRIAAGDNPELLMAGSDFQLLDGRPWSNPLLTMSEKNSFQQLLLADGF